MDGKSSLLFVCSDESSSVKRVGGSNDDFADWRNSICPFLAKRFVYFQSNRAFLPVIKADIQWQGGIANTQSDGLLAPAIQFQKLDVITGEY